MPVLASLNTALLNSAGLTAYNTLTSWASKGDMRVGSTQAR